MIGAAFEISRDIIAISVTPLRYRAPTLAKLSTRCRCSRARERTPDASRLRDCWPDRSGDRRKPCLLRCSPGIGKAKM